ncbi:MAG: 4Fe-4S dicluster domain-containing protein [Candidatus Lokiarchaeota archaeon]|nr:4Fe-4S dicluster domain-containing protein [Candidatus Lokiarchaeota archaeon]
MKTYRLLINQVLCDGCGNCQKSCPINALLLKKNLLSENTAAIYVQDGKAHEGAEVCDGCGVCVNTCHKKAITIQMVE